VAVRQQHGVVGLGEPLRPVAVARAHDAVAVVQAGAIVQPDHRRERPLAVRAEQRGLQPAAIFQRDLDDFRIVRSRGKIA
jgi:hypothetical protein